MKQWRLWRGAAIISVGMVAWLCVAVLGAEGGPTTAPAQGLTAWPKDEASAPEYLLSYDTTAFEIVGRHYGRLDLLVKVWSNNGVTKVKILKSKAHQGTFLNLPKEVEPSKRIPPGTILAFQITPAGELRPKTEVKPHGGTLWLISQMLQRHFLAMLFFNQGNVPQQAGKYWIQHDPPQLTDYLPLGNNPQGGNGGVRWTTRGMIPAPNGALRVIDGRIVRPTGPIGNEGLENYTATLYYDTAMKRVRWAQETASRQILTASKAWRAKAGMDAAVPSDHLLWNDRVERWTVREMPQRRPH